MTHDPFTDPPQRVPARTKRAEEASVQAAAKVVFFALSGVLVTVCVAVTVALWRWIV